MYFHVDLSKNYPSMRVYCVDFSVDFYVLRNQMGFKVYRIPGNGLNAKILLLWVKSFGMFHFSILV